MLWSQKKPSSVTMLPDIELCSKRLLMRPARSADWPQWASVREKNRTYLKPYEPQWGANALEKDFFARRLKRQAREWDLGQACAFVILNRENNLLIGGMNINNICRGAAQFASLGYWIDEDHQGQGLMQEAMQLTLRYCFMDLNLHRINCACLTHNARSKNLLTKAGFSEEGKAEKYLQIDGRWQDHLLFGLTREAWLSRLNRVA